MIRVLLLALATIFHVAPAGADQAAFVGLDLQGIDEAVAEALGLPDASGVLVRNVAPEGPAACAGVRRGDIIVRFGSERADDIAALVEVARDLKAGDHVEIVVLRGHDEVTLDMETTVWPEAWRVDTDAYAKDRGLGVTFVALTAEMRQRFAVPWDARGVLVSIVDSGAMTEGGLKRGDVVIQVNRTRVWQPRHVIDLLDSARHEGRSHALLLVHGHGGLRYFMVPLS